MGRNYLTGRDGDRINAVLAAAGYNFSLLLRWFEELLCALLLIPWRALFAPRFIYPETRSKNLFRINGPPFHPSGRRETFFTTDYGPGSSASVLPISR
jgi:hypothetical protein